MAPAENPVDVEAVLQDHLCDLAYPTWGQVSARPRRKHLWRAALLPSVMVLAMALGAVTLGPLMRSPGFTVWALAAACVLIPVAPLWMLCCAVKMASEVYRAETFTGRFATGTGLFCIILALNAAIFFAGLATINAGYAAITDGRLKPFSI